MVETAVPRRAEGPTIATLPGSLPEPKNVAAIETEALTKHYGDKVAVDALTLRIERGEIFGLLGPNGAGKTTTILMLLGLSDPSSGAARVDGLDPAHNALAVKRRVGYLPDDVGFYDELTGRQNLLYTAALNRLPRPVAGERIDNLLGEVGLADVADRKVRGYSRGMRQRLGLADALVKQPTILILDEPTVNIDPSGVGEILALVSRLRSEQGVTVLLSSHLLHQVEQVCDRIGIFVGGKLVAIGSVDELARTVTDRWVVEIGAGGTASTIEAALRAVPGVGAVSRLGERWRITADRDVRPALARAITDSGASLTHLERQGADLDAIYHRYFRSDDDGSND